MSLEQEKKEELKKLEEREVEIMREIETVDALIAAGVIKHEK